MVKMQFQILTDTSMGQVWPVTISTLLGTKGAISQMSGSKHKTYRRVLMRAFTQEALQGYVGTMQQETRKALEEWRMADREIKVFIESKVIIINETQSIWCKWVLYGSYSHFAHFTGITLFLIFCYVFSVNIMFIKQVYWKD